MTILLSFLMSMPCMSLHVTTKLHALFQVFVSLLFDTISILGQQPIYQ